LILNASVFTDHSGKSFKQPVVRLNKIRDSLKNLIRKIRGKNTLPEKGNYKIISLGLGQQSTALYLMSSTGFIERADYAIFSDPGSESKETYEHLKWLKKWSKQNNGIPIIHTGKKSLYKDLIHGTGSSGSRFASIPAFTKDENGNIGILKRQCTEEYKTQEIFRAIRKLYGLKARKRTPDTEVWLGISLEEMERMKYPRTNLMTFVDPFLNVKSKKGGHEQVPYTTIFSRADCIEWLKANDFPVPPKSACTFCPFQSDQRWRELKLNNPAEWKKVVKLDELIRNSKYKGVKQPIYLHRSAQPLKDVDFQENQLDLFISECSGVCGT
jgi:hypothetical protein